MITENINIYDYLVTITLYTYVHTHDVYVEEVSILLVVFGTQIK